MCKSKANSGLGFRDLSDFNQSLLAKHSWKIINEPQSFLSRLYKRRYFAKNGFLDYGKGHRSSYVWRSILQGRELLQRGLLKSVGNEVNTKVWLEKSIMDVHHRRPISKQSLIYLNLEVYDLITSDLKWRLECVLDLFPLNESTRILALPQLKITSFVHIPNTEHTQ